MAIMRRLTVCVRATNVCVTHTEGDVINNLPHPLMMMNLIILRKKWSGQNRTGRTGSAATGSCCQTLSRSLRRGCGLGTRLSRSWPCNHHAYHVTSGEPPKRRTEHVIVCYHEPFLLPCARMRSRVMSLVASVCIYIYIYIYIYMY